MVENGHFKLNYTFLVQESLTNVINGLQGKETEVWNMSSIKQFPNPDIRSALETHFPSRPPLTAWHLPYEFKTDPQVLGSRLFRNSASLPPSPFPVPNVSSLLAQVEQMASQPPTRFRGWWDSRQTALPGLASAKEGAPHMVEYLVSVTQLTGSISFSSEV